MRRARVRPLLGSAGLGNPRTPTGAECRSRAVELRHPRLTARALPSRRIPPAPAAVAEEDFAAAPRTRQRSRNLIQQLGRSHHGLTDAARRLTMQNLEQKSREERHHRGRSQTRGI